MLKIQRFELILILVIQVLVLLCFVTEFGGWGGPREKKPAQSHVLILSSWRSGSSFVGQLFSQHPDVFYLMEPAWHVWATLHQSSAKALHMAVRDLVRSIFKCDMSVYDAYMPKQRNKSALFQWDASRALCSPPACRAFQRSDIIPKQACRTLCSQYPFSAVEEACRTYSHVALKEVRILDIRVLYPLLTDPSLNLKIIHLVRDPRAVYYSRTRNGTTPALSLGSKVVVRGKNPAKGMEQYAVMQEVCRSHVEIYAEARQAHPSSLRGHYWLVRYEDIAHDPLGKAAELYGFVGLGFPASLQQWVHNITHGQGLGKAAFGTGSRNAANVSQAWRSGLPYTQVATLQDICQEAMRLLGYRLVSSKEEQQDLALSVLEDAHQPSREALTTNSSR